MALIVDHAILCMVWFILYATCGCAGFWSVEAGVRERQATGYSYVDDCVDGCVMVCMRCALDWASVASIDGVSPLSMG